MGRDRTLRDFIARYRASNVVALTEHLVETIIADNPGYVAVGVVPREDLFRSCHDNIGRVLELLALRVSGESPPIEGAYYDAARATGSRRAEQGLPLDDVLRSFRMGGRLIWEDLIAESGPALDGDNLRLLGTELWLVVDETSAQVAVSYHSTVGLRVRADEERRAALWEGLLSGRGSEPSFVQEAARALNVPVDGPIAVVAIDHPGPERFLGHGVAQALRERGIRSTWQHRAGRQVGVLELPSHDLEPGLEVLRAVADEPVGVSSVVNGLGRTGDALREAMLALRTVRGGSPEVVCYLDRLPDALLLSAPEVAARLVQVWLGPLLALPPREHRALLATLESWVESGGSASRAAALVPCHRNTVLNRIRRVVQVTGIVLVEGPPPVELALALRMWRLRNDL